MRNKFILISILALSVVCSAVYSYSADLRLSDVSLKNVEALADNEESSVTYFEIDIESYQKEETITGTDPNTGDSITYTQTCTVTITTCREVTIKTGKTSCEDKEEESCN